MKNKLYCGEHQYELYDNGGYISLKSIKGNLTQTIAVIHQSGNISILDTLNNKMDVSDVINSQRRKRVK